MDSGKDLIDLWTRGPSLLDVKKVVSMQPTHLEHAICNIIRIVLCKQCRTRCCLPSKVIQRVEVFIYQEPRATAHLVIPSHRLSPPSLCQSPPWGLSLVSLAGCCRPSCILRVVSVPSGVLWLSRQCEPPPKCRFPQLACSPASNTDKYQV